MLEKSFVVVFTPRNYYSCMTCEKYSKSFVLLFLCLLRYISTASWIIHKNHRENFDEFWCQKPVSAFSTSNPDSYPETLPSLDRDRESARQSSLWLLCGSERPSWLEVAVEVAELDGDGVDGAEEKAENHHNGARSCCDVRERQIQTLRAFPFSLKSFVNRDRKATSQSLSLLSPLTRALPSSTWKRLIDKFDKHKLWTRKFTMRFIINWFTITNIRRQTKRPTISRVAFISFHWIGNLLRQSFAFARSISPPSSTSSPTNRLIELNEFWIDRIRFSSSGKLFVALWKIVFNPQSCICYQMLAFLTFPHI